MKTQLPYLNNRKNLHKSEQYIRMLQSVNKLLEDLDNWQILDLYDYTDEIGHQFQMKSAIVSGSNKAS